MSGFEDWPAIGLSGMQMAAKMGSITSARVGIRKNDDMSLDGFDPYQAMLKRKKHQEEPLAHEDPVIPLHNQRDIQALEEFCRQYGIIGYNCGTMNPKVALQFLKRKMGVREEHPLVTSNKTILCG